MTDQVRPPTGFVERSLLLLTLRFALGGYAEANADRLAASAQRVAALVKRELDPLHASPRSRVTIEVVDRLEDASGQTTVVVVDQAGAERRLYDAVARAVSDQYLDLDEWAPPTDQSNAAAVANALQFLSDGLARYFVGKCEVQGIALFAESRFGGVPRQSADQISKQAAADRESKVPLYECLLRGAAFSRSLPEYEALSESFAGYLYERDGPKAFRRLLIGCRENPNSGADLVYGKNFEQLRDEWIGTLIRGESRRPVSLAYFARQVVPYLRPYGWDITMALSLMVLSVASAQVLPFTFRDIIDIVTGAASKGDPNFFGALWLVVTESGDVSAFSKSHEVALTALGRLYVKVLVLTLANFVYAASTVWFVYVVNVINNNVIRDLRLRFAARMHGVNAAWYSRSRMGDMISRFTSDVVRMAEPLSEATFYSIYWTFFLVGTVWSMVNMSLHLMWVAFLIVPVYLVANRRFGPALQRAHRTRQERLAQLNSGLEEQLFAHSLIRAYGLGGHIMTGFSPRIGEFRKVAIWADFLQTVYKEVLNVVDNFQQKIVLAAGGTLAIFGVITVGTIQGFNTLAVRFISTLHRFGSIYAYISIASASLRRVEEILRLPVESMDTPAGGSVKPESVREAISFEDVSFSYTGAEPTLSEINVTVPAGSKVAFVGPTGAGKSTLVNLIPRFYDVDRGAVKIDGQDIRSFSLRGLRDSISIVAQDTFIFNTTLMENIRLGRLEASDDEVIEAARGAHLHNFITTLPAAYDTLVGERGARLSGGQRQRVAIARALLRDAPIMILDEATSSLDAETEAEILAELAQVTHGKTVISITHRLGLAIQSDTIYVLQAGKISQHGSHEELIQQTGLYRKLFEDQNRELMRRSAGEQLDEVVSRIRKVPTFSMVPAAEIANVAHLVTVERYHSGEQLGGLNRADGKLYVLASGEVELTLRENGGPEQRLSMGAPTSAAGEQRAALVMSLPPSVSARALSEIELHVYDSEDLRGFLAGSPSTAENGSGNGSGTLRQALRDHFDG